MSMEKLKASYYELYGENSTTKFFYAQLVEIIKAARKNRSTELKKQDKKGNSWYLSEKMVGIMLYVDKYSGTLEKFESKIDYLSELGVTYVHFMPLLQPREGQNDGGYAVADYLSVDKRLGTMDQLERVAVRLKKKEFTPV